MAWHDRGMVLHGRGMELHGMLSVWYDTACYRYGMAW